MSWKLKLKFVIIIIVQTYFPRSQSAWIKYMYFMKRAYTLGLILWLPIINLRVSPLSQDNNRSHCFHQRETGSCTNISQTLHLIRLNAEKYMPSSVYWQELLKIALCSGCFPSLSPGPASPDVDSNGELFSGISRFQAIRLQSEPLTIALFIHRLFPMQQNLPPVSGNKIFYVHFRAA